MFCISFFFFCTRICFSFVFRHLEAYSSEEIDCPTSNIHNFGSFASIELIFFILTAAEFDELSKKLSRRERFAHQVARCCVDFRRFLACFCLYSQLSRRSWCRARQHDFVVRSKRVPPTGMRAFGSRGRIPSIGAPMELTVSRHFRARAHVSSTSRGENVCQRPNPRSSRDPGCDIFQARLPSYATHRHQSNGEPTIQLRINSVERISKHSDCIATVINHHSSHRATKTIPQF